ncbi:hypothetical protein KIN20_008646 [Parelaphostrongylus tenuis]|uniref:Uncharacterized protein n=1 Tax=Parelaphostrongylus tenuis TaxID=148309 RepID=A0AAD5QJ19_PARTN|nr:hypothetical protein KIN20_008646 [Parelaphostrongylus tenuis]
MHIMEMGRNRYSEDDRVLYMSVHWHDNGQFYPVDEPKDYIDNVYDDSPSGPPMPGRTFYIPGATAKSRPSMTRYKALMNPRKQLATKATRKSAPSIG